MIIESERAREPVGRAPRSGSASLSRDGYRLLFVAGTNEGQHAAEARARAATSA